MKEPKSFKYPRMYLGETSSGHFSRIRIIYPDGSAEWDFLLEGMEARFDFTCCWNNSLHLPNYANNPYKQKAKNGVEAVELMKQYDKSIHWLNTIFLGEIK